MAVVNFLLARSCQLCSQVPHAELILRLAALVSPFVCFALHDGSCDGFLPLAVALPFRVVSDTRKEGSSTFAKTCFPSARFSRSLLTVAACSFDCEHIACRVAACLAPR